MLSCLLGVVGPTQKLLVCMRVRPPCETWCSPIANGSGGASATGAAPAVAVADDNGGGGDDDDDGRLRGVRLGVRAAQACSVSSQRSPSCAEATSPSAIVSRSTQLQRPPWSAFAIACMWQEASDFRLFGWGTLGMHAVMCVVTAVAIPHSSRTHHQRVRNILNEEVVGAS
jgi:hypothetical protein